MKRNVEFTATELFRLMVAMNMEEIRAKNHDTPAERKAVTDLRDKIAREYLIAEGRQAAPPSPAPAPTSILERALGKDLIERYFTP